MAVGSNGRKRPIGKNKAGCAVSDGARRGTPGIGLENGAHLRRCSQNSLLQGSRRHHRLCRRRLQLAKPFVAEKEEGMVLHDRTADGHAVLSEAERRYGGVSRWLKKGGDNRSPFHESRWNPIW